MAFDITVDRDQKTVYLKCIGPVYAQDLMEYERVYWVGNLHLGYHHCVDMRGSEIQVDYAELMVLAAHASPTKESPYMCARSALVVETEEQFEHAEFYKAARHQICDPAIREVGVFYDIDDANAWLAEAEVVLLA